ncbi:hypothetical protein HanXRQr2_Chr16g0758501 [Helianthus annuus]|uniref:Uncharacterized protein n=1 Tax=Helianthus annuus TaxID=4232 RepID=A0A9K3GYW2_HELAN|nr:hypothetical protein HanXRQr2_Chr16g0758501 [Helianthus annuus]KAJ0821997.1 hypothetical protein HanPSC8_Chr16g0726881 [Helianthus annuus]
MTEDSNCSTNSVFNARSASAVIVSRIGISKGQTCSLTFSDDNLLFRFSINRGVNSHS